MAGTADDVRGHGGDTTAGGQEVDMTTITTVRVVPGFSKGQGVNLKKRHFQHVVLTIKKAVTTVVGAFFINIFIIK